MHTDHSLETIEHSPAQAANLHENHVFQTDDHRGLFASVADKIVECVHANPGPCAISLAGGNTPLSLYKLLATPEYIEKMQRKGENAWQRIHLFWSDERFVPHEDAQSNYGIARAALIAHVPIPACNIHPIFTDGAPTEDLFAAATKPAIQEAAKRAAQRYTSELQTYYHALQLDPNRPLFAISLLGIGEDGHIASLFPEDPQLDRAAGEMASQDWAVSVVGSKPPPTRITLSLPVVESANTLIFLATGAGKREAVRLAQAQDSRVPAGRIRSKNSVLWYMDRDAAPL